MSLDPRIYNPIFALGAKLGTGNMTYPSITGPSSAVTGATGATGATGPTGPTGNPTA